MPLIHMIVDMDSTLFQWLKEEFTWPLILGFWFLVYVLIAVLFCYLVWRLTAGLSQTWLQLLIRTFPVAFAITPSLIPLFGHCGGGVFPEPVIFVFIISIQSHMWKYMLLGGVLPVMCVWLLVFVFSIIHNRLSGRFGWNATLRDSGAQIMNDLLTRSKKIIRVNRK